MLKCIYPVILQAMSVDGISIKRISNVIGKSEMTTRKKLSGKIAFDINEAMSLNEQIFPNVPFKMLFCRYDMQNNDKLA